MDPPLPLKLRPPLGVHGDAGNDDVGLVMQGALWDVFL